MRIAVIGNGSIGKRHMRNLISLGYDDLISMDPSAEMTAQVHALHPQVGQYSTVEELFEQGKPDVAFICSPPQFHLPQLNLAIEHGCHSFVEKPFSLNPEGVAEALKNAEAKNLRVATGFNMRYVQPIRQLKQWLDDGLIGDLLSCRIGLSSYMPNWHPWEDYRECFMAFWQSGGGALFDYVHGIDMAQWFAGRITQLCSMQKTTSLEMETDDMAVLIGQTDKGVMLDLYFDFVDHLSRRRIELIGSKGTALWELDAQHTITLYQADSGERRVIESRFDWDSCYIQLVKDFMASLDMGKNIESDGWNGLDTQEVLMMAMQSNKQGKLVTRQ
ncbi:MAG: Gfo/Idh/MocA family oxidoreductase [Chromatiales bacterium]|jgi:predicted dehydrogenase